MSRHYDVDVAVAGGGSAGVAAAVGAARAGARVLLLERSPYLGGQSTHSCVVAYCGFHSRGNPPTQVVKGVGETVLQKLRALGEKAAYAVSPVTGNASIRFDPEVLKLALDQVMDDAGAAYLLHTSIIGVQVREGTLGLLRCVDDEGEYTVAAKSFVDATGDANLTHMAGCAYRWGDGDGATQLASLSVRIDRIPADCDTTPDTLKKGILAAKAAGIPHLTKEWGLILREPGADYGYCTIPSIQVDALDAKSLTEAERNLRRQARSYVEAFRRFVPGMEHCRMVSSGPGIGLRETRRIVGEETVTYEDVVSCRKRPDSVARGGWSPEVHRGAGVEYTHMEDGSYFDIPLGALRPQGIKNLWCAGRCISCDQTAHASVRVMGTGFATGHAAGVAAALTADGRCDVASVRGELQNQDALI